MDYPFVPFSRPILSESELIYRSEKVYQEIDQRRSVRHFSDRDIPTEVIQNLIKTAGTAPSGAHKQPWHFVAIRSAELKQRIRELAEKEENVVIEGWVPSVRQVYDNCKVFVAPLRSGAGIKGKVVDALAHGVPCVLSPVAAEGIAARDGVDVFIADSPDVWVKAIATLYSDMGVWNDMSRQALSLATARYGFARGVREMQDALTEVEIFTNLDNPTLVAS